MSVKRGGLGRNLSALLNQTPSILAKPEQDVKTNEYRSTLLDMASLQPGQYQPRASMDEASLQELAESIKNQGLLQPLVVREIAPERYEIIAGERRFRACQRLGMKSIPAMIRVVDNETSMALALIENLQREELNVLDHARAMARLTQEFSLTHQQIAELLCKSRASVSNYLRLLQLNPEVLTLLESGDLEMGHARCLLKLDEGTQLKLALQVVNKKLSVRETETLATRSKVAKLPASSVRQPVANWISENVQILSERLKTPVNVKLGKDGEGTLMIHYTDRSSLEQLVSQLMVPCL